MRWVMGWAIESDSAVAQASRVFSLKDPEDLDMEWLVEANQKYEGKSCNY